jgi:hypothetical protein
MSYLSQRTRERGKDRYWPLLNSYGIAGQGGKEPSLTPFLPLVGMVGSGGAAKELPLIQFNRIELRGRRATAKGFPVLHSMGWNAGKGRKGTTLTPFLRKEWSGRRGEKRYEPYSIHTELRLE